MIENLTLITGNAGKAREFGRLLGGTVLNEKIAYDEIQHTDVAIVAKAKAQAAYAQLKRPVLVDDTGLYITAWNTLPGALIAWYLDEKTGTGNRGILKQLESFEDRSARVVTALGYCDERGVQVFTGEVFGKIADSPRGDNGFGYDEIFIPEGQDMTFAEMTNEQKDAHSMRALAAAAMQKQLG